MEMCDYDLDKFLQSSSREIFFGKKNSESDEAVISLFKGFY
jgi:hypothetical protein